jgi:enamine deaminase RidA (YjgF/YER057c/UK114 family)
VPVRLVNPPSLMPPKGFSHAAVGRGAQILLAGQIGADGAGRIEAPRDLVRQFGKALDNLLVALRASGGRPEDLAFLRIYTTDVPGYRTRLKELGAEWRARFGKHYPAMVLVGVTGLYDPESMVEIEGIAHVD